MSTQEQKKEKKDKNKKDDQPKELSAEDKALKEQIELLVQNILQAEQNLSSQSLQSLKDVTQGSTSSMTSVPKPFKFLKDHYQQLMEFYDQIKDSDFKKKLASFLSVLSMTMAKPDQRITLKLLLEGNKQEDFLCWGHQYLIQLANEIGQEWNIAKNPDLLPLIEKIVPYFIDNNQEADAIDLLMEVEKIDRLQHFVSSYNVERVLQYIQACSSYCADQSEIEATLTVGYNIAMNLQQYTKALRLAIKLDNPELVQNVFNQCKDLIVLKQLAFMVARQKIIIPEMSDDTNQISSNSLLSDFYIKLAKELDVLEPKHPDQIYKAHLDDRQHKIDSSKANLASTYVNAFVNCGLKTDKLMLVQSDTPWTIKVADNGLIAAVGSLGIIDLWDYDTGSTHISNYIEMTDGFAKQGACIALGAFSSGVIDENEPAKAILLEQLQEQGQFGKLGAVVGLGLAYSGSGNEDLLEELIPLVVDNSIDQDISAFAALSLGLIFVGKMNEEVGNSILQTLSERSEQDLNQTNARYFALALGLIFLGQQDRADSIIEALSIIDHPIKLYCELCLVGCAYVGSGNVLKIQQMFNVCNESKEEEYQQAQQLAILAMALISTGEPIGLEMSLRHMNILTQYAPMYLKRCIPLALAVLSISNPKIQVMDVLVKFAHDEDQELKNRALFALGLVGAGTNNSRLADILRQQATYYANDPTGMFLIRISQGLLHLGKGMLSVQPYYSENFLLNKVGMSGILVLLHSALDIEKTFNGKYHWTLFYTALSVYPKMMYTLDEKLEHKPINVRVGQAVDVVGQAGKPKKITGFQTHQSPVLISYGERAELATEEFIPVQDTILENFIIIKNNPDYQEEDQTKNKRKATS